MRSAFSKDELMEDTVRRYERVVGLDMAQAERGGTLQRASIIKNERSPAAAIAPPGQDASVASVKTTAARDVIRPRALRRS